MYTVELLEEKQRKSLDLTPDTHSTDKGLMECTKLELLFPKCFLGMKTSMG